MAGAGCGPHAGGDRTGPGQGLWGHRGCAGRGGGRRAAPGAGRSSAADGRGGGAPGQNGCGASRCSISWVGAATPTWRGCSVTRCCWRRSRIFHPQGDRLGLARLRPSRPGVGGDFLARHAGVLSPSPGGRPASTFRRADAGAVPRLLRVHSSPVLRSALVRRSRRALCCGALIFVSLWLKPAKSGFGAVVRLVLHVVKIYSLHAMEVQPCNASRERSYGAPRRRFVEDAREAD